MSETRRIRVLLVDDHPVVRQGLRAVLQERNDIEVVGEAGDGGEAWRQFALHRPDVTLLDLCLPGVPGLDLIVRLRRVDPAARIVVVTFRDGDEDVHQALAGGAQGYLLKDASGEELVSAIRAVHAGQRWISRTIAGRLAERVSWPALTPREREVLGLVVEGMRNDEIGATLSVTEGTVKGYLNTVFDKLGVSHRTQAAICALKRGFAHLSELSRTGDRRRALPRVAPGPGPLSPRRRGPAAPDRDGEPSPSA